jgi:hypothetical protein
MDIEKELDCNTGSIPTMTFEEVVKYCCEKSPDVIVKVLTELRPQPCIGCKREKTSTSTCYACRRWTGMRTDWFEQDMSLKNFFKVSLVDASNVKSQWQAHFLQVFPLELDKLPRIHESDRQCFEKYWEGDKHTTYDQFMLENYPAWR